MSLKRKFIDGQLMDGQHLESGNKDDYQLMDRIGSGRYGEVFVAMDVMSNRKRVIKVLKPIKADKVLREIQILRHLNSGPNIIHLKDVIVDNGSPSLVFSFVSKDTLKTIGMSLNANEIRIYLHKLLKAIDFAHQNNVIHRDIKPSNVVIDRNRQVLRLIDWGLSDFYTKNKVYSTTVASRFYKSPELLLSYTKYDYSLDIWSYACILAGLVFRKEPFFVGLDNLDQLKTICMVMGTECLGEYIKKYRLKGHLFQHIVDCKLKPRNWLEFIDSSFESLANNISIDLIDKLLVFDHKNRLTSVEALSHPFFDSVKNSRNSY